MGPSNRAAPLLIVLNPRRIAECMEAFAQLPLDVAYLRGMLEQDSMAAASELIAAGGYDRYLIVADDVVVTGAAVEAVVRASKPERIVTGFCNLDSTSRLVNVTKGPLRGDIPHPDAYSFRTRITQDVPTGFVGFALTCIPQDLAPQLLPLGCFRNVSGAGFAGDFHLSKRCEQLGIPMFAVKGGFVRHVKERWNEPDQAHEKRLRIGEDRGVRWQLSTARSERDR